MAIRTFFRQHTYKSRERVFEYNFQECLAIFCCHENNRFSVNFYFRVLDCDHWPKLNSLKTFAGFSL